MQNGKEFENYIPQHLDDPKYVGNFELNDVVTVLLSFVFIAVAIFKGSYIALGIILISLYLYFAGKKRYSNFLDGYLYWHFGFVRLPKKQKQVAESYGIVPTYIRDFEE